MRLVLTLCLVILLPPAIGRPGTLAAAGEITHTLQVPVDAIAVEHAAKAGVRMAPGAGVPGIGSRVAMNAEGYLYLEQPGRPPLPFRIVSFILPQGETAQEYDITPRPFRDIGVLDDPLLATAPSTPDGRSGSGGTIFPLSQEGIFPPSAGKYLGTGYLHGYAIASFAVFPVRVDGSRVLATDAVEVRVATGPAPRPTDTAARARRRPELDARTKALLSTLVVNPEAADGYVFERARSADVRGGFRPTSYPSLEGSAVDYVIITSDALASEYQRLADWKTAKGVPTVVRTTEWIAANTRNGVDLAETIRFFIRDAYEKWGTLYVLLGGDVNVIPARYGVSRYLGVPEPIPADIYYGCVDGSWNENHDSLWGEIGAGYDNPDLYSEVYVGRLPAANLSQAAIMIDKVIAYETPLNTEYTDKLFFGAEVLFPPEWHPGDTISLDGGDLTETLFQIALQGKPIRTARAYENYTPKPGAIPLTRQTMIDSMAAGASIVNHIGHGSRFNFSCGDASVLQPDAEALDNGDRLFLLYMIDCTVSAFDYTCISESFLRNPNGGAAATIGASNLEFPGTDSHYMNEFYDLAFNENVVHVGETYTRSRLPRTPWALLGENPDLWTHYVYTLLGDPEMPLFTGPVSTVNVAHVPSVGFGTTGILVNVTSGGQPVDSACVCLSKEGDDYETGWTNALGNVVLDFTAESTGSIDVVVTGLNLARHESAIAVTASPTGYVCYWSLTVDDDMSGGTFGNGNGVIDAGETVDMTLTLKNTGGAPTGTLTAVLRCTDAGVAVLDSTANMGVMGSGQVKPAFDPVRVDFDEVLLDEQAVEFRLVVKNNGVETWYDRFKKEVHAPDLRLTTLRINDAPPLGNGNGVNEAGEQFRLYYGLKNYGTGLASGLTATLVDLDGQFVFYDVTDAYAAIASMEERENTDGFHIQETSVTGENRLEVTVVDLFGRAYRDTIELRRPSAPTGLVFDSSWGPDRLEISWTKSVSTDVQWYNVYRSDFSGGPYVQVNEDPVEHAVYLNTGLTPSTVYFYRVTAVDASGNESAVSATGSASTNPPQMTGFPVQMKTQTTSSPVVGDIDGDGDLEIVVGNEWIYAWHHDGLELRDGDGDPQSWGVLTTVGDEFTAPVALARLDNQPGLDIMAADLYTKKVYCVDYTGTALPGWPQAGLYDFRAAPVAGDLDGDGFNEVIAVDSRGIVYVWHADGTEWLDGDNDPLTTGIFFRTQPVTATHFETPTVCDIDGDHKDEIIVATRADSVWVFNGDRSRVPGWPQPINFDIAGSICAGDVDGDDEIELLVQSKGATGQAYLFNHDGTIHAGWPVAARMDVFFSPSPALADFDHDGKLECVLYTWDGASARIMILTYQGTNYPGWPKLVSYNYTDNSSLTVADVDGDGGLDIILGDESKYIRAWDINGTLVPGFPVQAKDAVRSTPFLTDVDQDGDIDMVVHCWDQNIYAWDLNGAYNADLAPWPTYQANSHRNGTYGYDDATGIGSASFFFSVRQSGVTLTWTHPGARGELFDIRRGEFENDRTAGFVTVASDLAADAAGTIEFDDVSVEMGRRYVYELVSKNDPDEVFTTPVVYIPAQRAELHQNHPNPFNPTTRISYVVPEGGSQHVALSVFDVTGARIRMLVDEVRTPGRHEAEWDGRDQNGNVVGSGVYFYRMQQQGFTATKKMILLK